MSRKAFTLIELLVVVAIIGILAAVGVVAYNGYTKSAKISVVKTNHNTVKNYIINEIYAIFFRLLSAKFRGPIFRNFAHG